LVTEGYSKRVTEFSPHHRSGAQPAFYPMGIVMLATRPHLERRKR